MMLTLLTVILTGVLVTVACVGTSSESAQETRAVTVAPSAGNASERLEVSVGPARQECYGPFQRMCLVVDHQLFYSEIDGFTHEPGHEYRLRIERYDAFPGQAEPPQDAGRYGYRLIEELSKNRADGEVTEATVAPTRVTCPGADELCLLVDGAPQLGVISGFEFRAGYDYRVRYEQYGDGSRQLLEVLSQTPSPAAVAEITVGPWRVQCRENASITAACIVVDGLPFYGHIEDFTRRHGYEYTLRVEKYDLMPGVSAPPPESSKFGYRLLEVLSEQPASTPPDSN